MKVAFCSSEVFPFAKTGGLADVAGALPKALVQQGAKLKVFMPLYKGIKPKKINKDYGYSKVEKVEFYFIRHDDYFLRDALYGTPKGDYPDNLDRFLFFCEKTIKTLKSLDFKPDIIHNNDWQTSLIPVLLKAKYGDDKFFAKTKTVLTVHNLAYQGLFKKEEFKKLGLDKSYFTIGGLEYYEKINLLKGGILFSDWIATVSPTYAKQIQTSDYGCGLEGMLREKRSHLSGILNGVDYEIWNPKADKYIYKKYDKNNLKLKVDNKMALQKELGLAVDKDKMLLGMVSRLAEQKGLDIFSKALDKLLKDFQIVILGFGDEKYHKALKKKASTNKKSLSLHLAFDERLAHKIYASSDVFLMPSRFEPCGLSQLISYKYATVPVVHKTGGLSDTVTDCKNGGGGFVLNNYSDKELIATLKRAKGAFEDKDAWLGLMKKIVEYDFSWEKSARSYMELYKQCQ